MHRDAYTGGASLPMSQAGLRSRRTPPPRPEGPPMHLLVVEDDPTVRRMLQLVLGDLGDVVAVSDREAAQPESVDLIGRG